jgi:HK97 family phage portal protein
MTIFDKIFKRANKNINNSNLLSASFVGDFTGVNTRDSTSFACIDLIASAFANLTGSFYGKTTKQILREYHLYDVLNNPNIDETKYLFMYQSIIDYFHAGNIFWYKYDVDGRIAAIYRLNPNKVRVKRGSYNQKIFMYDGKEYTSEKILHIPSRYGYDGLIGKSIFSECSNIFKISSELDIYLNNSFNNSIGNRLVIDIQKEYPNATEEQIQQLKNKFQQNYTGIQNAGKPLVKSGKIEYSKIETDFKDNKANQLLENREFQEKEIAKLFGVPLTLLKGTDSNDIESLYILFIENAIRPIATVFEQSINKLIPLEDRYRFYFEYSYNSLMKTSIQTRIDTYSKQITNGILTVNEIRRKENLTDVEAGDNLFIQANLMPLTQDIINAYMAKSKLLLEQNLSSPDTQGNHDHKGDDKI